MWYTKILDYSFIKTFFFFLLRHLILAIDGFKLYFLINCSGGILIVQNKHPGETDCLSIFNFKATESSGAEMKKSGNEEMSPDRSRANINIFLSFCRPSEPLFNYKHNLSLP
jgi:hypothetical protein